MTHITSFSLLTTSCYKNDNFTFGKTVLRNRTLRTHLAQAQQDMSCTRLALALNQVQRPSQPLKMIKVHDVNNAVLVLCKIEKHFLNAPSLQLVQYLILL